MYTNLDLVIIIVCAILFIGIYIYRKATGQMWYGINWGRIFYEIRRGICKLLLKIAHK